MSTDVAIIDYKMSNMFSVHAACLHLGLNARITQDKEEIANARAVILPGVGTFASAMEHLNAMQLIPVIKAFIQTGKPFMGICLGMQLLMTQSEEFGTHQGLNIIPGTVKKFPAQDQQGHKVRVPHIGWNTIRATDSPLCDWRSAPLNGIKTNEAMYFVHSFYVTPQDSRTVLTQTDYAGICFCSSLAYKNIFACQFHPEKSGREGLKILKNFSESIKSDVVKV